MTRAIQCRREDLTPAELDSLTGLFTHPRPDMAVSFDDLQDAKKMQSTTGGGMTSEDAHLTATVASTIIFGIIVGVVVTIVLSSILIVEAMAPTAAEVMAVDFSLEHKLAEAAP